MSCPWCLRLCELLLILCLSVAVNHARTAAEARARAPSALARTVPRLSPSHASTYFPQTAPNHSLRLYYFKLRGFMPEVRRRQELLVLELCMQELSQQGAIQDLRVSTCLHVPPYRNTHAINCLSCGDSCQKCGDGQNCTCSSCSCAGCPNKAQDTSSGCKYVSSFCRTALADPLRQQMR